MFVWMNVKMYIHDGSVCGDTICMNNSQLQNVYVLHFFIAFTDLPMNFAFSTIHFKNALVETLKYNFAAITELQLFTLVA